MDPIATQRAHGTLLSIQALRGVAASIVVFHHTIRAYVIYRWGGSPFPLPLVFSWATFRDMLSIGVDLFFVISGFIMVFVSTPYRDGRKPVGDFVARRLIRIYPMYLFMTLLICAIELYYVRLRGVPRTIDLGAYRVVTSLLFIPSFNENGEVAPITSVGWTLLYEMLFYACFAVALKFFKTRLVTALALMICSLIAIGYCIGDRVAVGALLQQPLMAEFLFGSVLGKLYVEKRFPAVPASLWFGAAALMLGAQLAFPIHGYRFLAWGIPSMLIVGGFVRVDLDGFHRWGKAWLAVGDASYSIYLFHLTFIYAFALRLAYKAPPLHRYGFATDIAILISGAAAIFAGWLLYRLVERPTQRRLSGWYARLVAGPPGLTTARQDS